MEDVRIYGMPACRMVSSACGMFGDGKLERFDAWFSTLPERMFPRDFLWFDNMRGGFVWYYMYEDGMDVPEEFEIVDFPGGLYAVVTGIDGEDNAEELRAVDAFVAAHGFIKDESRASLGNVITPKEAQGRLGYCQMDYYTPIK